MQHGMGLMAAVLSRRWFLLREQGRSGGLYLVKGVNNTDVLILVTYQMTYPLAVGAGYAADWSLKSPSPSQR